MKETKEVAVLAETVSSLSAHDLQSQLRGLLDVAHQKGLDNTEIIKILSSELEFETELAHAGHRLIFQIIDLGPIEADNPVLPLRNSREVFQNFGAL